MVVDTWEPLGLEASTLASLPEARGRNESQEAGVNVKSQQEMDTRGIQSTGESLNGWQQMGEKSWERQMAPDREALQGNLDFILREVRASCQCFHKWRAARSTLHSVSLDSTLNAYWVVREPLGPVVIMSALKWLAESSGCGSGGEKRENTCSPGAKSQRQKLADGE